MSHCRTLSSKCVTRGKQLLPRILFSFPLPPLWGSRVLTIKKSAVCLRLYPTHVVLPHLPQNRNKNNQTQLLSSGSSHAGCLSPAGTFQATPPEPPPPNRHSLGLLSRQLIYLARVVCLPFWLPCLCGTAPIDVCYDWSWRSLAAALPRGALSLCARTVGLVKSFLFNIV